MELTLVRVVIILAMLSVSCSLSAHPYELGVTTYVTKIQEERHSTRWTLTEWLLIKERMRMMDLWLAMFSDPKKDHFRPELNLSYGVTRGALALDGAEGAQEVATVTGAQGRAQLWLTNLVSSAVGVRTLNIDFGVEGFQRRTGGAPIDTKAAAAAVSAGGELPTAGAERQLQHTYYTGNLRLFGKSVQDSSLVVKYGEYRSEGDLLDSASGAAGETRRGVVAGGELCLYLTHWLGAEGNYLRFGDSKSVGSGGLVQGTYYDYLGFIEISLLRLVAGAYKEDWSFSANGNKTGASEIGVIGGAKLQF